MPRRLLPPALALLALGCTALTPYEQVRDRVPASEFVEVGGRAVHVVQEGSGEPLVLLHGFGASSYSWRLVTPPLAVSFRCVAIDLHGFGYTERPRRPAAYTVAGQLALVLGVMDALGIESAHVAGHSYGGALALHLAARHRERVRSLILVDSAGPEYPWERRHLTAGISPLAYTFARLLGVRRKSVRRGLERSFLDDGQITGELVEAYYERLRVEGLSRAYRGLTAPTGEPRAAVDFARLDLPTLVVWGADDAIIPLEDGRRAAARIPGAELAVLEDTGHIPLEERPQELARRMLDFLARQ